MYRGNYYLWQAVCCVVIILGVCPFISAKCSDANCSGNGVCKNEACVCYDGWQGPQCQYCGGKVRLGNSTGVINSGLGYYPTETKCTWLIEAFNSSITLHLVDFATECGWDYLYIHDGDSVDSPLLAVFSGLMYKGRYSIRRVPEVVATSGSALVHFYSDPALNLSGFNMTYRRNACPSSISGVDCSGNGVCIDKTCTCNEGWTGAACNFQKCPNGCGESEGRGVCEPEYGCKCSRDYKGNDCSQVAVKGYWETITTENFVPSGSASHGAVVWRDSMYVTGGESYGRSYMLLVYDFKGNVWDTRYSYDSPSPRYGHSTVIYDDKIFLYGGDLGNRGPTSELWSFDINAKTWENITVKAKTCNASHLMCGPLKTEGHTATVVTNSTNKKGDRMVVLFGHSPKYGYLNTVQEFYFDTREWHIVNTTGYPVKGGYGHSAAWDPLTEKIYVYGGIISESETVAVLSSRLYSYDPNTRVWTSLNDAPSARFLHTATFISGGLMVVFGGNTYNDTSRSSNAKCYSSQLLAYDVTCDTWQVLQVPMKDIHADLARFGHSAVVFEGSLYIYGGFDGQILSDMLKYTPGDCSFYNTSNSCLSTRPGVKCVWDTKSNVCVAIQNISRNLTFQIDDSIEWCPKTLIKQSIIQKMEKCEQLEDCLGCVQTPQGCNRKKCGNNLKSIITELKQCSSHDPTIPTSICKRLHTCSACTSESICGWTSENKCVTRSLPPNLTTEPAEPIQCPKACSERDSCLNCTQVDCIWCQNEGRCVDQNAYRASFPYGQCRDWTTTNNKCSTGRGDEDSQCSFYSTCAKCREDPACGWCDDGSKTGLGKCMPGGYAGPTLNPYSLPLSTCPTNRWHFTTCPLCQCNGHASCVTNTSTCVSCSNLTMGDQCEQCIKGYWGNPNNGGKCQACECNDQASECDPDSGKCYCAIKGYIGDHCDKCDEGNYYKPDPITKKSCYYNLTTDFQFTFNMSKKEYRYYTQINFLNTPIEADIDLDFSITCSVFAKLNITVRTSDSKEERSIFEEQNCTSFSATFSKSEYPFGIEGAQGLTTFYVYVYDFQTPMWITVSFIQYPTLRFKPHRIFSPIIG